MSFKIYDISCAKCNTRVLTYHKHGAGRGILRLYLSNIVLPENLAKLHKTNFPKLNDIPNLTCPECSEVLGVPAISKGKKQVFRMRQGYFHRKLKKR